MKENLVFVCRHVGKDAPLDPTRQLCGLLHWILPLSILAALLVIGAVLPAAGQEPSETRQEPEAQMPQLLWATDKEASPYPLFVSADRALNSEGRFDEELFSEASRLTLERDVLNRDFSSCGKGFRILGHFDPQDSWTGLPSILADSDYVVVGRVSGIEKGFWFSFPGTVFRITPERWLKSRDRWLEKFLFIPSVDMKLGEKRVCMDDARFPELPESDWQVVVSYKDSPGNRNSPLFFVDPAQIIVISESGRVSLPKFLADREPEWNQKSGGDIVEEISRIIDDSRSSR